jgi:hypothetical protein
MGNAVNEGGNILGYFTRKRLGWAMEKPLSHMISKRVLILLGPMIIAILMMGYSLPGAAINEVWYQQQGNFRAKVYIPTRTLRPVRYPVIIYCYDEFIDRVGEDFSANKGYDLNRHILEFSRWNVIVIVPMERYRKLNAINGAIRYAKELPQADPNRIHIVGISEGGVLGLIAGQTHSVRSITVITPLEINDKGTFSYISIGKASRDSPRPVLLITAGKDTRWRQQDNARLLWFLQRNSKLEQRTFQNSREWFWNEKNPYMWDIRNFINRNGGLDLDASTYPY